MPDHAVLCLEGTNHVVVPSVKAAHVLGFELRKTEGGAAWQTGTSPAPGECTLHSATVRGARARIVGWRDVLFLGVLGFDLVCPDTLYAKYLGCVIVQNGLAIGVVQATISDAWGYPVDLLLASREPKAAMEPLRLVPDYDVHMYGRAARRDWPFSLALGVHVRDPGRMLDRNTVQGIRSILETTKGDVTTALERVQPLFNDEDTCCVDLGGAVIGFVAQRRSSSGLTRARQPRRRRPRDSARRPAAPAAARGQPRHAGQHAAAA